MNWIQIVIQAVYFFNPLIWYTNKRLRTVREELCDDRVVRHLGNGHSRYARSMLRIMEETSLPKRPGFVMISLTGSENRIKERIGRIIKTDYTKYKALSIPAVLVFVVPVMLTIIFACEGSDTLTSEESIQLKEVSQQSLPPGLELKISGNGEYEICGVQATRANLEQVYREQLLKRITYYETIPPTKIMVKRGFENSEDYKFFDETIKRVDKEIKENYYIERFTKAAEELSKVALKDRPIKVNSDRDDRSKNVYINGTSEAKFLLGQIIRGEQTYKQMGKSYVDFDFGENCQSIGFAHPENSKYEYAFKGDTAFARERIDANGDGDTDDEITLSVDGSSILIKGFENTFSTSSSNRGDSNSTEKK